MTHHRLLLFTTGILLTGFPLVGESAQITPNPNPSGSMINIIGDPLAFNNEPLFNNQGTITIDWSSTFANNGTLNNTGMLEGEGTITNNNLLTNSGTLREVRSVNYGVLINNNVLSPHQLVNHGTLTNSGDLGGRSHENFGLLVNSGFMGTVYGLSNEVGGTVINSTGARLSYESAVSNMGRLINAAELRSGGGGLNNSGHLINAATGSVISRGGLTNSGTVTNSGMLGNTHLLANSGTLTNSGTVTHAPGGCSACTFDVAQSGTLVNAGTMQRIGTYTQTAGHTINNGTLAASDSVHIHGGSLTGLGTVTAPTLTLATGALLTPGTDTQLGTFTLNGDLQSSGNLAFHLGGLNAGEFDVLKINGTAAFTGGNLRFDFVNGFTAAVGNSWKFLSASAFAGWNHLVVTVNGLAAGLGYRLTSNARGDQTLTIVHKVPEPDSLLLLGAALVGLAVSRWKLSQTLKEN